MTDPVHLGLKARQRAERDAWPPEFGLRIHRAISWIGRAEHEAEDPAAAFLFYWIAFNAAYAAELDERPSDRAVWHDFFRHIVDLDGEGRIYAAVWTRFSGPIRVFLENRYVFGPFWAHHNGQPGGAGWEVTFEAARRRFHTALRDGETALILSMLFDRLYVLRNQLVHGGATWGSSVNRDQLRDGAEILRSLGPLMVDLMMNAPDGDWGAPMYPVVEAG
jgi:hypothetical protein